MAARSSSSPASIRDRELSSVPLVPLLYLLPHPGTPMAMDMEPPPAGSCGNRAPGRHDFEASSCSSNNDHRHHSSGKPEPEKHNNPPDQLQETRNNGRRLPRPSSHHCGPVLRGAPFLICSNCFKLIQLPADFAAPSDATRRMRCGSCSQVLSYSYRDDPDPYGKKRPESSTSSSARHTFVQEISLDHKRLGLVLEHGFIG